MRYQTAPCPAPKLSRGAPTPCRDRARHHTELFASTSIYHLPSLRPAWRGAPCMRHTMRMAARLIDGKAIAQAVRAEVAQGVAALRQRGARVPGLAVVLVGENPASAMYVRNKRRACEEASLYSVAYDLPAATPGESELVELLPTLNADPAIDGILVQLPLPAQIRARAVIEAIDPAKDVAGFHPYNPAPLGPRRPPPRPRRA